MAGLGQPCANGLRSLAYPYRVRPLPNGHGEILGFQTVLHNTWGKYFRKVPTCCVPKIALGDYAPKYLDQSCIRSARLSSRAPRR